MDNFRFQGAIPGSKSIFNRILIAQSYFSVLDILGFSDCDDVRYMREGLKLIRNHSQINCGEGGTTFRFMALRTARHPGVHELEVTSRLMQRPKSGLLSLLRQLNVQTRVEDRKLFVISEGWKNPRRPIYIDISESSQYASALLLNTWLLDFDLEFQLTGNKVSESYFQLTVEMVKALGMHLQKTAKGYLVPAGQRINQLAWAVEADISSAFTMATAGALAGESIIENFPTQSSQPDIAFLEIFKKMDIEFQQKESSLIVRKAMNIKPLDFNLSQCPDLFPVLAMLCSWASGVSRLYGASHLALKESNRIQKVSDLFNLLQIQHEVLGDGMVIYGNPQQKIAVKKNFNPDQDHRMVMAATLMKLKGHQIKISESEAIKKSFPEFWDMIGIHP